MTKSLDQVWKRPLPICGSIYSKAILLVSFYYFIGFLNHPTGFPFIGLVFLAIGGGMMVFELNSIGQQRNRAADELDRLISQALLDGQKVPTEYSLFLRRFGAEDREPPIAPPIHPVLIDQRFLPNTFESFLSDQMHGWCPLVGLGRPEEAVGAGKIVTQDSDWQSHIKTLLSGAKIIFVVPALSEGAMWETREILNDSSLLSKAIVLAAPEFYRSETKREWNAIREKYLHDFGCVLPEYDTRGMAFRLSGEFKAETPYPIGAQPKNLQIRKILLQLGFIDAAKLAAVDKEYPTRCAGWVLAFIVVFVVSQFWHSHA